MALRSGLPLVEENNTPHFSITTIQKIMGGDCRYGEERGAGQQKIIGVGGLPERMASACSGGDHGYGIRVDRDDR